MSDDVIQEFVSNRLNFDGDGSLTIEKIGLFSDGFIVSYKIKKGKSSIFASEFNGTFAVSLTEIRDWQINKIIN